MHAFSHFYLFEVCVSLIIVFSGESGSRFPENRNSTISCITYLKGYFVPGFRKNNNSFFVFLLFEGLFGPRFPDNNLLFLLSFLI